MARVLVTSEDGSVVIPIITDQVEGLVSATCPIHGEVDASYNFEDTVQVAEIHIEHNHEEK